MARGAIFERAELRNTRAAGRRAACEDSSLILRPTSYRHATRILTSSEGANVIDAGSASSRPMSQPLLLSAAFRRSSVTSPQRFVGGYAHDPNVDAVLYFVSRDLTTREAQDSGEGQVFCCGAQCAPEPFAGWPRTTLSSPFMSQASGT
jgi:hypothetical protein